MWVAAVLFMIVLGLLLYLDTRKPKNFPPGPPWLPILGSTLTVASERKRTGYLCNAMGALAEKYGPILGLRVGKERIVVLCDYESVREVLCRDVFDGRPRGIFYESRTWGERRGLLLTDEVLWQEQRRFVMRHLRDFGYGRQTMTQLVEEECSKLLTGLRNKVDAKPEGVLIRMNDLFGVPVLNTLWNMLVGVRFNEQDAEVKELQSLVVKLLASVDMVGSLFSQFPLLRFIAPELSGYNNFIYVHQRMLTFLKGELEKHKATYNSDISRDLMDVYLKTLNGEKKKSHTFSEIQLLAICLDLFMAGSETTTKSLGFGFLYLLLHPDVQKHAQEEIDNVVGHDRPLLLSDRASLPYVEAVSLETIRKFMGSTFTIPHRALQDCELQGYHIPKDTMIIANMHGVLTDKKTWGDPEAFRPERFLDAEGKVFIPEQYTPFGLGKHRCMGEVMAKQTMFMFIGTLLQNFNFCIPPGSPPPTTQHIDGVTPATYPFDALVSLRT